MSRTHPLLRVLIAVVVAAGIALAFGAGSTGEAAAEDVVWLTQDDFTYGTYIIDQPGVYRLAEDISFNPNSPATLTAAIDNGLIDPGTAFGLGLASPVDAYSAGNPLYTQFQYTPGAAFTPGGPMDARYDPAAYGIGFFAAIAIETSHVELDLNGYTIEQSAEHALLQRFFAVIELADQPFLPAQGPASFGEDLAAAEYVTIHNGTIGRSSHHGIHGNANEGIVVEDVTFDGYEVAAIALNGVNDLEVRDVVAINRKDVPVLGTFSAARFISTYVNDLVRTGSTTTLTVGGVEMTAVDIQADLRDSINAAHHDLIVDPNMVGGRAIIRQGANPDEFALFHNHHGVVDGNSYSFLVNHIGVAVNGFPTQPDGETRIPSKNVLFHNVRVVNQRSFINEIPAIDNGSGGATIDPVGAVFQVKNVHPLTGDPVTTSSLDDATAIYTGNVVANAQALVAKAANSGDVGSGHLDISRMNISDSLIGWVEGATGSETLADIGASYLCNGDSMFHVNKGTIGFKMDSADGVRLVNTAVLGLENLGMPGTDLCGDYSNSVSHPAAALEGYGGAPVRAYTFAGSTHILVAKSVVRDLSAMSGPAVGYAILTDTTDARFINANVQDADGGWGEYMPAGGPNGPAYGAAFYVGAASSGTSIVNGCASGVSGYDGSYFIHDEAGDTISNAECRARFR